MININRVINSIKLTHYSYRPELKLFYLKEYSNHISINEEQEFIYITYTLEKEQVTFKILADKSIQII